MYFETFQGVTARPFARSARRAARGTAAVLTDLGSDDAQPGQRPAPDATDSPAAHTQSDPAAVIHAAAPALHSAATAAPPGQHVT